MTISLTTKSNNNDRKSRAIVNIIITAERAPAGQGLRTFAGWHRRRLLSLSSIFTAVLPFRATVMMLPSATRIGTGYQHSLPGDASPARSNASSPAALISIQRRDNVINHQ